MKPADPRAKVLCVCCGRAFLFPMGHRCNGGRIKHTKRHARKLGIPTMFRTINREASNG